MFAVGVILVAVGGVWVNTPPAGSSAALVEIVPGAGAGVIAHQLKNAGCVRSALWVKMLSRLMRADRKLKAGTYRVPSGQRVDHLLRSLIRGQGAVVRVTIPEGFALWQMAQRLETAGVCPSPGFLAAAAPWEGFLFPDTYFFEPGLSASVVVAALRRRFDVVWNDVFRQALARGIIVKIGESDLVAGKVIADVPHPTIASAAMPPQVPGALRPASQEDSKDLEIPFRLSDGRRWTVREVVTLASLIERETARPEEQPRVSAVYHNRLKIGMRLECDPTVQYSLGEWKRPLLKKDLAVDSPYNTYRRYGLPPGPIAAPGRGALEAALAPADEASLYFVSDGEGGHWFSVIYQDHLRAVRRYRRQKVQYQINPTMEPMRQNTIHQKGEK